MIWLLAGCPPAAPVELVDPSEWRPVAASDDPLAAHRPEDDDCPPAAWGEEDGTLEVQTGACAYAAFSVPLPVALRPGDVVAGGIWHADLDADAPAEAHVALLLGDDVVWERFEQTPGPAWAWTLSIEVDDRVDAGSPLGFHLHNHGFNSWNVGVLRRE